MNTTDSVLVTDQILTQVRGWSTYLVNLVPLSRGRQNDRHVDYSTPAAQARTMENINFFEKIHETP